ncbi:hypothetical protein COJ27_29530 [Bacillus cereus]|uniref:hypothetical protein n=1 Tax=Bacillus cereus group TaxID=86661 RepID=UPI000BF8848A|nr:MULTISPECIES: hypothetical protein [Bacillus cereus group]PFL57742.1 hypothetical protein COJ27_29530 [Bacillus cereus]PGC12646.1 hypothetical protein COM08_27960 [Bacillus wiedmannii]
MHYVTGEAKIAAFKILVEMNESMNKLAEAITAGDLKSCTEWNEKNLQANKELHRLLERKEVS